MGDIDMNGYSFSRGGVSFHIFQNQQLTQDIINSIHQYVPGWYPPSSSGYLTICTADSSNNVAVYQIERILNLFTILPKFMSNIDQLETHMNGIISYIHDIIKKISPPQVANEIGYRIAFYKPNEISQLNCGGWTGSWRFVKNTDRTLCAGILPQQLPEWTMRLSFDDNYNIKTGETVMSAAATAWSYRK